MFFFPNGTPPGFNLNSDMMVSPGARMMPNLTPQSISIWQGPGSTPATPQQPAQSPQPQQPTAQPASPTGQLPGMPKNNPMAGGPQSISIWQGPPSTPSQTPTQPPSLPAPPPMPTGPSPLQTLMDPTPYNNAVDRGNQFIRGTPTNASPLMSFSPAFNNLSKNMQSGLNSQWNARGSGLQNQAGLEFSRKAGAEVPRFLLSQQLGLRGLENDWLDLQNEGYRNDVLRSTGGLNAILQLLGAFGSFF